jgi:hypothetical protein
MQSLQSGRWRGASTYAVSKGPVVSFRTIDPRFRPGISYLCPTPCPQTGSGHLRSAQTGCNAPIRTFDRSLQQGHMPVQSDWQAELSVSTSQWYHFPWAMGSRASVWYPMSHKTHCSVGGPALPGLSGKPGTKANAKAPVQSPISTSAEKNSIDGI